MSRFSRHAAGHRPLVGLAAITQVITLLAALGCEEPSVIAPTIAEPTFTKVSVSPSHLNLVVGGVFRLSAHASDSAGDTYDPQIEWSSPNPAVATVRRGDGTITAISAGLTTIVATAGTLQATALVSVRPVDPPVAIVLSSAALSLVVGDTARLTAVASDSTGKTVNGFFQWSSADPAIAIVGGDNGKITAMSPGLTAVTATLGPVNATAFVSVSASDCPTSGTICEQWALSATASSEFTATIWSAQQAAGQPNAAAGCTDDDRAWASMEPDGVEWLELLFKEGVIPTEIRIHENYGVGAIVRVEVRDEAGAYHTVHTAQPVAKACPRVLSIPITGIATTTKVVRITLDQRTLNDWNEIDAVKLIGTTRGGTGNRR